MISMTSGAMRPDSRPYYEALQRLSQHWNLAADGVTLLRNGQNHVFAGLLASGTAVIIRITDDTHRSSQLIQAELDWLSFLRRQGCTVTTPLPAKDGDLLKTFSAGSRTLHVVCFARFTGSPVTPGDPQQWNPELFVTLGRTLGRIHRVTATFQPRAGVQRYPWYEETEFRHLANYRGVVPDRVLDCIQSHIARLREMPRQGGHYGLIHNDVYAENFFYVRGEVQLFDFDQCCYGWFLQDLVNPIYPHYVFPGVSIPGATLADLTLFFGHLLTGYRTEQPLSVDQLRLANALLQLKEGFVYLILNAQLAQWATTLHLPLPTLRHAVAVMEQRILTDAPVVDLNFTRF
jgi:Ser/Thr protein kinase RdoA (MazF antagonist)